MSESLEGHLHRKCGGHYARVEADTTIRVSGMQATVPRTLFRCDRCGDDQVTVEHRELAEKAAIAAIREAHGLLAPKEIKALRERLALTHAQLGDLLYGVPKGLVEGWEKGRYLQNREADALLRSLEDRATLEQRAAKAGVVVAPMEPAAGGEGAAPGEEVARGDGKRESGHVGAQNGSRVPDENAGAEEVPVPDEGRGGNA